MILVCLKCLGKMSSPGNHLVLSFHESSLRKSDIDVLRGPYWLSDQLISFYFVYLEKKVYEKVKQFLFVCPVVTQCLKFVSSDEASDILSSLNATEKDVIFFALNDNKNTSAGGSHWSLLVVSRPENTFFHFDSFGSNMSSSKRFFSRLKAHLGSPDAGLVQHECLQQSNDYDCGIHVICIANQIAQHALRTGRVANPPEIQREEIQRKRSEILDIIQKLGGKL